MVLDVLTAAPDSGRREGAVFDRTARAVQRRLLVASQVVTAAIAATLVVGAIAARAVPGDPPHAPAEGEGIGDPLGDPLGDALAHGPDDSAPRPVLLDLQPQGTTLLTGDELVRRGYRTVGEALADVIGVVRFPTTLQTRYGLRGVPDALALVIDGVPLVVDGERDLLDVDEAISLSDVERVEVVRGPVTSQNGVGALAGVVRITTRRPGLTGAGVRLASEWLGEASFRGEGMADVNARAGALAARASVRLAAGPQQRFRLHAVPTRFEQVGAAILPVTKQDTTAVLAADDTALIARGALEAGPVLVDAWFTRTVVHQPLSSFSHGLLLEDPQSRARASARARALIDQRVGPARIVGAVLGAWHEREDGIPLYPASPGIFEDGGRIDIFSRALTLSALVRAELPLTADHRVIVGLFGDLTEQSANTDSINPVDGEAHKDLVRFDDLTGTGTLALDYQGDLGGGVHVSAGGVGEVRSAFPVALAPRLALVFLPAPEVSTRLSYAEGTRAPDRYDMAALAQAVVGGQAGGAAPNDTLRPERVRMLEAGAGFAPSAALRLSADLFALRHEDALAAVVDNALLTPINLAPRHVLGGELQGRVEPQPGLTLEGGAALARTVDGPDLAFDAAQLFFQTVVAPGPGVELGGRARARMLFGVDRAAGSDAVLDSFGSLTTGDLTLVLTVRNMLGSELPSRDLAALPSASDVALPAPDRSLFVSIEGRL
ncbi:MAG: TonB-dependent receptor [Deltaproteobacteria bacterium]|nr:TonB-dependent receptor [Deltaproteobacteria bacterium]